MLVGKDFDKIEISLFGFELVEPNAFIGDSIILIVALLLASKTKKLAILQIFLKIGDISIYYLDLICFLVELVI